MPDVLTDYIRAATLSKAIISQDNKHISTRGSMLIKQVTESQLLALYKTVDSDDISYI